MADEHQNVETTGHQWDDEEGYPLKEFNNPLPTWWLYTFYATIAWAVVYVFLYPAIPFVGESSSRGLLGWSMYAELQEEMDAAKVAQKPYDDKLAGTSIEDISNDNELFQYAISGGKAIFGDNCAPCHGSGGSGSVAHGFPSLVDDDWLYGGSLAAIEETIQNGRAGMMPAHLDTAGGGFTAAQVGELTEYVLKISQQQHDAGAAERGEAIFKGDAGCNACHGDDGKGSVKGTMAGMAMEPSIGAPNLTDGIWLYGGSRETVHKSISAGRSGKMPAWGTGFSGFGKKLDPLSIKEVTLYVHSLGGGK